MADVVVEAAAKYFEVDLRPYRGWRKLGVWAWTVIYAWLNYGSDGDYGPARLCIVRRSDGAVVREERCLAASKVAGFKTAWVEELEQTTVDDFTSRHGL